MIPRASCSILVPYTTLFRSVLHGGQPSQPSLGAFAPAFALLLSGGTMLLLQAGIGAARAQVLGPTDHGRFPVEDDRVVPRADQHGRTGHGSGLEQLVLHTQEIGRAHV